MSRLDADGDTGAGGLPKPLHLACFALCIANATYLLKALVLGYWILDPAGNGVETDFVSFWAAGRLALDGAPAAAYDWTLHKQAEIRALGYDFKGYYSWQYPPFALFIAALLALGPYAVSFAAWSVATFALYAVVIRRLVGHPSGWLVAGACSTAAANLHVGQNGAVTAALIGGTLGLMRAHPVLSGCCLGLLTYKPHFGLLFPLVLIASGRWTVFWSAAATALLVSFAAWIAFGTETWAAFFHWLPIGSQTFLSEGRIEFSKLQSIFGLIRLLGGGERLAFVAQGILTLALLAGCCILWRTRVAFELQAAALATAIVLATPYVFMYDLVVLAVPLALFIRMGIASGFHSLELAALGLIGALLFSCLIVQAPVGLAASVVMLILIAGRLLPSYRALMEQSLPLPAVPPRG